MPALGVVAIKAKVDSGARSSALHVESLEAFDQGGAPWVRFSVDSGRAEHAKRVYAEAAVIDRRAVTDSGGHRTIRVFIETPIELADNRWSIEINLTRRSDMLFPMLLGRTALSGRFLVDSSRSFACGEPR